MPVRKQSKTKQHSTPVRKKKKTSRHISHKREKKQSQTKIATNSVTINNPQSTLLKTCQEVEIGDIGGFGDVQELEDHQKQCGDTATEYCTGCGKHLCRIHYMLLHGDHDSSHTRNVSGLA